MTRGAMEEIRTFVAEAKRHSYLTREEEAALARAFAATGDRSAQDKLTRSHMRLVVSVARTFSRYGIPMSDLVSEGNVGLVRAIEKFEPEKGFRLSTYASWWIKAAIQDHVLKSWSMVKLATSSDQKRLFFGLRREMARLGIVGDGEMGPAAVAAIAKSMKVSETDVVSMSRRLHSDVSLNAPMLGHEEDGGEIGDNLADERDLQDVVVADADEHDRRMTKLRTALDILDVRERRIFEMRNLTDDPPTLEVLGAEFNVSKERIRQIEAKAFQKVRHAMTSSPVPPGLPDAVLA